jgi:hypothetical protein
LPANHFSADPKCQERVLDGYSTSQRDVRSPSQVLRVDKVQRAARRPLEGIGGDLLPAPILDASAAPLPPSGLVIQPLAVASPALDHPPG